MVQLTGILASCFDCGYDLRGQCDEPRCPECGRLNIPDAYRREVHELVDSGQWFFSNPLSPFARRRPGWFWSLDRPGDIRRSFRRAGMYIGVSMAIIVSSIALANACVLRLTGTTIYPARQINEDTGLRERIPGRVQVYRWQWGVGAFGWQIKLPKQDDQPREMLLAAEAPTPSIQTAPVFMFRAPMELIQVTAALLTFVISTWAFPAGVGLWTQVRRGLPGFARASHTVIAACNYQAHRLIYAAALCALLMASETLIRVWTGAVGFGSGTRAAYDYTVASVCIMLIVVPGYAALGWIGLLRSDFTKQIVRSRWHAARIVWMYAILMAAVLTLCVSLFIAVVF